MSTIVATEYTVYPTGYDVNDEEGFAFAITVNNRGKGWAVVRRGSVLTKDAEWEYEPSPSSRDDAFFERCRFTEEEAKDRALAVVDQLTINGWTYARHIAAVREREQSEAKR